MLDVLLIEQLLGLVARGTKIDHLPGDHDGLANAAAGAASLSVSVIPITPEGFARGVISFGRPDMEAGALPHVLPLGEMKMTAVTKYTTSGDDTVKTSR